MGSFISKGGNKVRLYENYIDNCNCKLSAEMWSD
jgi:hypothetical protein